MNTLYFLVALLLAPLYLGIINQVKAFFAGRRGPGLFRLYFDLAKLIRKNCPRSTTTSWLFDLAPSITLASTLAAGMIFPWYQNCQYSLAGFSGAILFFYLLGTGRFFTVLGALDTGSAFEGMGASREVEFSALVEPTVFIILGFLTMLQGSDVWTKHGVPLLMASIAFFAIVLSENCRVPFDDPETHLELTMIHEAMILDNAGPDLCYILFGASVKFELLAAFLVSMLMPQFTASPCLRFAVLLAGIGLIAVIVGLTESTMARMRFLRTPQTLLGALMLATLATLLFVLF